MIIVESIEQYQSLMCNPEFLKEEVKFYNLIFCYKNNFHFVSNKSKYNKLY